MQYAQWIAEATSLPAQDVKETEAALTDFDLLVLGSPVVHFKPMFHRRVRRNLDSILSRPTIFFSVSCAGVGSKLDRWMGKLAAGLIHVACHPVAVCGCHNPRELNRYDRVMLIIGGLFDPDRKAAKQEMQGFDNMARGSIGPIVEKIREFQA